MPPWQAILDFCREVGITRADGEAHLHKLEHHIRADLDAHSRRALAVLRPLRLVLTNLAPDHFQAFAAKVGRLAGNALHGHASVRCSPPPC